MKSFDDFPDEILVKIFNYNEFKEKLLLRRVSNRFNSIIFNELKNRIRFSIRFKQLSDEEFDENLLKQIRNEKKNLYEKALNVLSNSFNNFYHLLFESIDLDFDNSLHLNQWKRLSKSIESLEVIDCTITDFHLFNIFSELTVLSELYLNNNQYFFKINKNSPKILPEVSVCLSNLKVLDFSGNKSFKLSDALFVSIGSKCDSIEALNVSKCKIVFHFQIMRRYYGSDCCDHWKCPTDYAFTFAILKSFVNKFGSHLKRLDLSQTDICFEHLLQLIDSNNSLKELILINCLNISPQNVNVLRKIKPNLTFVL